MAPSVPLRLVVVAGLLLAPTAADALVLKDRPSPRNAERPQRAKTDFIILHTTEGAPKGALTKLRKNGEAHYLVDRDGTTYRIVDKDRVAYHAGRSMWRGTDALDRVSVGIEVVGYHNRKAPARQVRALRELIRQLREIYDVPSERVLTHARVAYGRPNRYHRYHHRGRKRCAMGLGTAEMRAALGLGPGPARDPDVDAKRLRVADRRLFAKLFPKVRLTRAGRTKGAPAPKPASPAAPSLASSLGSALDAAIAKVTAPAAKDADPPAVEAKTPPARKALPKEPVVAAKTAPKRSRGQGIAREGRKGAREGLCVVNDRRRPAKALAGAGYAAASTIYLLPDGRVRTGAQLARGQARLLRALPRGTRVLTGKRFGGYVKPNRAPSEICGAQWRSSETVYRFPTGRLVSGPQVDPSRLPRATMVFCAS